MATLAKELLPALDNLDRALEAAAAGRPAARGRAARARGAERRRSRACGIESFSPLGEMFDPAVHEAMATAAAGRAAAASGTVVEVYQPGYRLGREHHPPGARGRGGVAGGSQMATRPDYYKTLGRRQEGDRRGDQEGLPQARAQVPPRPQPRRQEGRGALQGDLPGPRRARRPREAQAVRQRHAARSRPAAGPGGGFGGFGNFDFDASSMGDILSNLFGGVGRAAGAWPAREPRRPRARERGNDLEAQVSITFDQAVAGAQVPLQVPMRATCATCHGTGAKPGTTPSSAPAAKAAASRPRARGCSRSPSRARAAAARGRDRGPLPDLPRRGRGAHRQAPAREHPRRRARRQPHPPRRQGRARTAAAARPATCT